MTDNILTTLKILIIGESGVGKSRYVFFCCCYDLARSVWNEVLCFELDRFYRRCFPFFSLMLRFTDDEFDSEQSITIGVDFKTKVVNIDGVNVKLGM